MVNIIQKTYKFGNVLCSRLCSQEQCVCCGNLCFGMPLCKDCKIVLEQEALYSVTPRCKICGKVLLSENEICMTCRNGTVLKDCDSVFPLCSYKLWKKNLVFEWKINNRRILTEVFADLLYASLCMRFEQKNIPAIVPVPPHKGKVRTRGWDQVEDLCVCLHRKYGLKILHLLENCSFEQQKKKNFKNRLARNNAFILSDNIIKLKKNHEIPEEVLLLDDVITTGATINACSKVLKQSEIIKVNGVSIFIVD